MSSFYLLFWDCKVEGGWGELCVLFNDVLVSGFLINFKIYFVFYYFLLILFYRLKVLFLYF